MNMNIDLWFRDITSKQVTVLHRSSALLCKMWMTQWLGYVCTCVQDILT